MPTATATAELNLPMLARQPRRISKEEFLRRYSDKEDGYKYEWNNGFVEKTTSMNQLQQVLQDILLRLFVNTETFREGGIFTSEGDMDTSPEQMCRPDIAIYTAAQKPLMRIGINQVAPWVAEVISPTDNADKINTKLIEYFEAGVQVVWHIFPASKQVYVYTSPDDVTICRGKTVCSGAPALPDFQISAADLFA